ncbi:excisionase family DNA binding protein [Limibacillus sp. MBR-115]
MNALEREKPHYRVREVAAHFDVTASFLYKQIAAGDIKAVHIGNTIRIPATEVRRLESTDEPATQ